MKNKITKENGRSMVEMLGVLAIAGIITLGGLAGYRMAMKKIRANSISELIAAASVYAQTHNTQVSGIEDLDDDYDKAPECVERITAETNGKVSIIFTESDYCTSVMTLVGTSFGKCRWTVNGQEGTFNPTSDAVKADGTCA